MCAYIRKLIKNLQELNIQRVHTGFFKLSV